MYVKKKYARTLMTQYARNDRNLKFLTPMGNRREFILYKLYAKP